MGTTLQNGVYLPNEGERNCYAGLKTNWEILDQKVADVTALQQAVAGALHREIVASLPTTDIDPNTIYMILSGTSATENVYNEFMYVNNAWELIGTSATDLTNYYTKAEVDGKLLLKANASDLTSHTGDTTIHVTANDKTKWNNGVSQAYVVRYASVAVSDNSTVPYTDLNNTDNVKANDLLLDTNGKFYQITSVDTANETVSVTTPLTQLAVDENVMHLSGNETASGEKTFNNVVPINGAYLGNEPSATFRSVLLLRSRYDTAGKSGWLVSKFRSNSAQGALGNSGSVFLSFDVLENEVRTNGILRFYLSSWSGNAPGKFFLLPDSAIESFLGSSANKWSAINGINPDALSLPDLNNGIDISGYITNFGAGTVNEYTPVSNGWISIAISGDSPIFIRVYNDYGFEQVAYSERNDVGGTSGGTYTRFGSIMIPCIKNVKIYIIVSPSSSVLVSAKFFPCQGNV